MIASLPMYDRPEVRSATDALWAALAAALRRRGIAAPDALDRSLSEAEAWTRKDLLLSQTCGYPYATRLRGTVRLVATPAFDAFGCDGARYASAVIARKDDPGAALADFRGRRAALNARDSQSGCNTLRHAVAPLADGARFFSEALVTGAHAASALAVAKGEADVCAVDGVTWTLIARHDPSLADRLKIVGRTAQAPGLPYVTAASADDATVAALRDSISEVFADQALAETRAALLITGAEIFEDADYDRITDMEREAAALGYPELA